MSTAGGNWGSSRDAQDRAFDLEIEEDRLPWLASPDDDSDQREVDTARVVAFSLSGLFLLLLIIGGLWWVFHGDSEDTIQPDGSTIAAPETPYKTRPENPGGMTFEGTGDTSFAVAEGQSREGRIAELPDVPDPADAASGDSADSKSDQAEMLGVGVQVGAYTSREDARQGWSELHRRYPVLHDVKHRIVEGQADIGRVYRLQAVRASRKEARLLCRELQALGAACQVKR